MLLGPLFLWELVRTSRRTGRWWTRVAYACVLLLLLGAAVNRAPAAAPVYRDSPRWLADVAGRFYPSFATSQLAAVLLLGPVFAVSIVEEKTRHTLPFLLASSLTDWEIVFGKFAIAWLRVFEVLASGLPFASICLLLGGVAPEVVFADFALCLAAAWASCGLAVLGSVSCRRMLDVLLAVYLAQLLWYALPVVAGVAGAVGYPLGVPDWVLRINGFRAVASAWSPGTVPWWDSYGLSIAAMLVFGLSCQLGGWSLLRGFAERYQASAGRSHGLFRRFYRRMSGAKDAVWDQPILWRELRSRRTRGMEVAVWCLTVVAGATVLAVMAWEWKTANLQRAMGTGPPALGVITALSTFCLLSFLALPYLAVAGATAFAEERDGRLMDFLRVTDLEQREVVRAKAIRLMRIWAGMMLLPTLLIVCLASVRWTSPTGCLLMAGRCLSSGTFAAMLGLAIGLRAHSTFQAILVTLVTGLIGGFFIPLAAFGVGPGVVGYTMLTVSPPVHCYFLAFQESPLGPPGAILLAQARYVAVGWTAAFAVASVLLYRLSLAPAGPWRERLGDTSW